MSKWITGVRTWRTARCAPIALCVALGACSSTGDNGLMLLADPGKYQYHNCQQLATARTASLARQKELRGLIDKAEQDPGGVLVGVIAYRTDYIAVSQDLKTLDATARDKNCPPPPPSPAARRSDTAIQ